MNHIIDNLGGIEAFGIFSICLFVVVFTVSMVLAFCLKKPFLKTMSRLPLEDEPSQAENSKSNPL
ncbi:MAG: hypothetical protein ACLQU4_18760 [Limisphaerales bacterium]